MVIAFLSGSLTPEQVASVEGHAGACANCLDLLATVMRVEAKPADAALSPHASSVGRYLILGLIGRGGMGEVYAAYDPELDRRVALKLLNQDGPAPGGSVNDVVVATERRARLLREAKAIARLSHPNVVVVHDAGTWNDRVFIAMELVEGETLDAWLRVRPRTRSEILEVFVGAGRGLAAAHAAGLVHRDFKPQNVIVGRDGKARVTDFGLARRLEAEGGEGERDPAAVALPTLLGSPVGSLTQLTRTGMLIGTPSYMAPEQFRAAAADPRSDQFSFCVALYEALYGQRPFTGATLGALRDAVSRGQMAAPPDRSTVPSWLRRTVLRGLEVERDARYPSMSDLLDALDRDPTARARRLLAGAAIIVALVAAGVVFSRARGNGAHICRGSADKLAGVWEAATRSGPGARREMVRRAFLSSGAAGAAETWERVSVALDRYADRWMGTYVEACEATHVRGEQSAEALDLRMGCLQERLGELKALTDLFSSRGDVTNRAVDAVAGLGALDRCGNVPLLRAVIPPPQDPKKRAALDELQARLARLKALRDSGGDAEGLPAAAALVQDARGLGYKPLIANALLLLASFQDVFGDYRAMELSLYESVEMAEAARLDDTKAFAAAELAGVVGYEQSRPEDGERWARYAEAILDRLGAGHDRERAWILTERANMAARRGDWRGSVALERSSLALKEKMLGRDHPDVADSVNNLANAFMELGDYQQSLALNDRALKIYRDAYGDAHPRVAQSLSNRGETLNALGRSSDAEADFRGALARWETALRPDNPLLGYALTGLGIAELANGQARSAIANLERALAIRERESQNPVPLAETRFALARALSQGDGDPLRARALALRARATYANLPLFSVKVRQIDDWIAAQARH